MAEQAVIHIGENSPQEVAFKLMQLIGSVEKRDTYGHGDNPMTREWIISTYCQCLYAVQNPGWKDDALKMASK